MIKMEIPDKTTNQRGDTIIEVLMAIAVIGMVLGSSFGIVNRSLAIGRDSQERSEALKIAESQLEKLKTATSDPSNGFFSIPDSTYYCLDNSLQVLNNQDIEVIPRSTQYNAGCRLGSDQRYRASIKRDGNVFTVIARWDSIRGSTVESEVKMLYRT